MKISIIAVGSLKEKFWQEACSLYLKRIKPYSQIEILEINDSNPKQFNNDGEVLADESKRIQAAINKIAGSNTCMSALCIEGDEISSEEFADQIESSKSRGRSHFVFIIGASCGLADEIKNMCEKKLSFGKITLPHNLARVVLLEQLYRAFKINSGETYHK